MSAFNLAAVWVYTSLAVLAGVLALGCLGAIFLALRRGRWFLGAQYLLWGVVAAGMVFAFGLGVWKFSKKQENFATTRPAVIAYFFPGLFFLPFLPEPMRRCKNRLRQRQHHHR